jgi:hypothetical protein
LDNAEFADGSIRRLLWYGGPITPDLPSSVVARYSDHTPAISQIHSGKGVVVISGLHPAVNKDILARVGIFEKDAIAPEYAWELLEAVLDHKLLPTF